MAAKKEATVKLAFEHEVNDDGTLKVTSGRKHRLKEKVDPDAGIGLAIGTIYLAEHVWSGLGSPEKISVTIDAVK